MDEPPHRSERHLQSLLETAISDSAELTVPVGFDQLRERALATLDADAQSHVRGGAGSEETVARNTDFSAWRIYPRMLQGVADRSLSVELLGRHHTWPLLTAPIGVLSLLHKDAELALAAACADLEVPLTLSMMSSVPLEDVSDALGDVPKWFQYYWVSDQAVTRSLIDRVESAGFDAFLITVDSPVSPWRNRPIEQGFSPFPEGRGLANFFTDPTFTDNYDVDPDADPEGAAEAALEITGDPSLTYADIAWLAGETDLPLVVKGILHPVDARAAIDAGADAVYVSNHGGRQIDGSISTIEALPRVVDGLGADVPVLFDSGIRRGADAFKALALGADAVLLGRPWVFGLALAGREGVEAVLRNTITQLELTMALSGVADIGNVDRDFLVHRREL